MSKAQAIRDYFSEHGLNTRPKDVISGLKNKGIVVAPAQVSNIKKAMRGKPESETGLNLLIEASRFIKQAGGLDAAKRALDTLTTLQ